MAKKKNSNAKNEGQVKYDDPRDAYLSTKPEMLITNTTYSLKTFYPNAMNDIAVIAEDKHGYYITGKSFIGAKVLDPYRLYHRDTITVTKTETGFDIETDNTLISV